MHLSLVDVLRCPRSHEPSALVATVDRTATGGSVEYGMLACPICDARFEIEQGGIIFEPEQRDRCRARPLAQSRSADAALRAAALLGLVDPGGIVVLGGVEGTLAQALCEQADISVVLLNPPGAIAGWNAVTPMYADASPFAAGVLRGVMLNAETGSAAGGIVGALRAGGRLIAPVSAVVPEGMRELARDAEVWVAERVAEPDAAPVMLRRAKSDFAGDKT